MGKTISKKAISLVIAMIMVLSAAIVSLTGIVASAANDTMTTATEATFGMTYSDKITDDDTQSYYKIDLYESGTVILDFNSTGIENCFIKIYNHKGNEVWSASWNGIWWNGTTGTIDYNGEIELISGIYYIHIFKNSGNGNYALKIGFTGSDESFTENEDNKNNSLDTACKIDLDTKYFGQLASNDDGDYYKFILEGSGTVNFDYKADGIANSYVSIYDINGNKVWEISWNGIWWNETTQKTTYNNDIELISGTYYILFSRWEGTGNYNFKLEFKSANESFKETIEKNNNAMEVANEIEYNQVIYGQLATNDGSDYYKFMLPSSGTINFDFKADGIEKNYIAIYDINGNKVWEIGWNGIWWNETTQKISWNDDLELISGTYFLHIAQGSGTGNYSIKLTFDSAYETFDEAVEGETNNSVSDASEVELNKGYNGQIAINDDKDYYKFELTDQEKITLNYDSDGMESTYLAVYNAEGVHIWEASWNGVWWNDSTQKTNYTTDWDFSSGTYYFYVARYSGNGNYTFSLCEEGVTPDIPDTPVVTIYTLSYDANGGSGAPAAQTGASEYTISSAVPVRSGYKFLGWAFDKNASSAACTGGASIALSADTVLYAVWEKVETPPVVTTYTLSYNANGGSGAPAAQSGATTYTVSSAVPVRSGYKFLGWSTSASATSASYTAGKTITLTKNTTLYAVWQVVATEPGKYVCPYCGEKFGEENKYEEHYEEEIILRNIAVVFKNPSRTLINYGDSIILHIDTYNLPAGSTIKWSVNNGNFAITSYSADGKSCTITPNATGATEITATVYDAEGREICSDSVMMSAKAGLWQKIVAFFKTLFGLTAVYPEIFKIK